MVPPGTVCSGSCELFLQQSNCVLFCSPQDLLTSASVKAKLALCVPCSVFLGEIFSVEHLVVFPKQQCAFGDYPPQNCTRRGLADSLHLHIPKHIYMRQMKQVITRTRVLAYAAVGSISFLIGRHCPSPSMVSTMQSLLWQRKKNYLPAHLATSLCPMSETGLTVLLLEVDIFLCIFKFCSLLKNLPLV